VGKEAYGPRTRHLAAVLAFVSQGIHLWVLPGQLAAALLPGIFFFWVAVGQGLLGASLLFGGGRWTARFGVLLNVFVILVWLLTRALSIPQLFEPIKLPVEGLGTAASLVEIALLVALLRLGQSLRRQKRLERA
jgi:hypothetical protein